MTLASESRFETLRIVPKFARAIAVVGCNLPGRFSKMPSERLTVDSASSGQFSEWRPYVNRALNRYEAKTGVTVNEQDVLTLKAWWEELEPR